MKKLIAIMLLSTMMIACKKDENPVENTVKLVSFSNGVWVSLDGDQYDLNKNETVNFNPYGVNKIHVVCNQCAYSINGIVYSGTKSFEGKMFR